MRPLVLLQRLCYVYGKRVPALKELLRYIDSFPENSNELLRKMLLENDELLAMFIRLAHTQHQYKVYRDGQEYLEHDGRLMTSQGFCEFIGFLSQDKEANDGLASKINLHLPNSPNLNWWAKRWTQCWGMKKFSVRGMPDALNALMSKVFNVSPSESLAKKVISESDALKNLKPLVEAELLKKPISLLLHRICFRYGQDVDNFKQLCKGINFFAEDSEAFLQKLLLENDKLLAMLLRLAHCKRSWHRLMSQSDLRAFIDTLCRLPESLPKNLDSLAFKIRDSSDLSWWEKTWSSTFGSSCLALSRGSSLSAVGIPPKLISQVRDDEGGVLITKEAALVKLNQLAKLQLEKRKSEEGSSDELPIVYSAESQFIDEGTLGSFSSSCREVVILNRDYFEVCLLFDKDTSPYQQQAYNFFDNRRVSGRVRRAKQRGIARDVRDYLGGIYYTLLPFDVGIPTQYKEVIKRMVQPDFYELFRLHVSDPEIVKCLLICLLQAGKDMHDKDLSMAGFDCKTLNYVLDRPASSFADLQRRGVDEKDIKLLRQTYKTFFKLSLASADEISSALKQGCTAEPDLVARQVYKHIHAVRARRIDLDGVRRLNDLDQGQCSPMSHTSCVTGIKQIHALHARDARGSLFDAIARLYESYKQLNSSDALLRDSLSCGGTSANSETILKQVLGLDEVDEAGEVDEETKTTQQNEAGEVDEAGAVDEETKTTQQKIDDDRKKLKKELRRCATLAKKFNSSVQSIKETYPDAFAAANNKCNIDVKDSDGYLRIDFASSIMIDKRRQFYNEKLLELKNDDVIDDHTFDILKQILERTRSDHAEPFTLEDLDNYISQLAPPDEKDPGEFLAQDEGLQDMFNQDAQKCIELKISALFNMQDQGFAFEQIERVMPNLADEIVYHLFTGALGIDALLSKISELLVSSDSEELPVSSDSEELSVSSEAADMVPSIDSKKLIALVLILKVEDYINLTKVATADQTMGSAGLFAKSGRPGMDSDIATKIAATKAKIVTTKAKIVTTKAKIVTTIVDGGLSENWQEDLRGIMGVSEDQGSRPATADSAVDSGSGSESEEEDESKDDATLSTTTDESKDDATLSTTTYAALIELIESEVKRQTAASAAPGIRC